MEDIKTVFIWNDLPSWGDLIPFSFPDNCRRALLDSFREHRDSFEYVDDQGFVESSYSGFGDYGELLNTLASELSSRYSHVRMFHCCRPTTIDAYYREGIKILNFDDANKAFQDLVLGNPLFPNLTTDHLQSAFDDMADSQERNGCVYFGLDDRFLIECCSHYLRNGSEYFQALAVQVDEQANSDIKAFLKSIGSPTVFVVNVPIGEIPRNEIVTLASEVLTTWLYNYAHELNEPYKVDFGILLREGLAPGLIVSHYCPELA